MDSAPVGRDLINVEYYGDHLLVKIGEDLDDSSNRLHLPQALHAISSNEKLIIDLSGLRRLPDEALGVMNELATENRSGHKIVIAGANEAIRRNITQKKLHERFDFVPSAYEYLSERGLGEMPQDISRTEQMMRTVQEYLFRQHRALIENRVTQTADPTEMKYVEDGKPILNVSDRNGIKVCRVIPEQISENNGICKCFSDALDKVVSGATRGVIVDFSNTNFLGDLAVGPLIAAYRALGDKCPLFVVGAKESVLDKFNKLRVLETLKVRDSEKIALLEIEEAA